ncbi:hypothetical protein [Lysobacter gummosus]|uniref:hypothetical protein n=1 Tax=Lysobacter gummosus TaxID=262324 RepID=UPI00362B848A
MGGDGSARCVRADPPRWCEVRGEPQSVGSSRKIVMSSFVCGPTTLRVPSVRK